MRDLYEVLGVAKDASASDIKKAYHRLAKQYHPDLNPGDKAAEEKFKEAANAYQVLSDEEQRARYDRFGPDALRAGGGGPGGTGFNSVEDIFSAFGDMFGDFFGGRTSGGRRTARGADLRVDLKLSFAEAVWGTTKELKVARDVPCGTCSGSGARPGTKPEPCSGCNGRGQVVHSQGFFMVQSVCPRCRGEGRIVREPCTDCNGRRVQSETSTLSVTVPPGVDDGQTLRLAGKGEQAAAVAPPVTCTSSCTSSATSGSSATARTSSPTCRSASSRPRSAARSRCRSSTTSATAPTGDRDPPRHPARRSRRAQGPGHPARRQEPAAAIRSCGGRSRSRPSCRAARASSCASWPPSWAKT
jgi:hypothetical protein